MSDFPAPEIQLAMFDESEGRLAPFGRYASEWFGDIPRVGDVISLPEFFCGQVRVLSRLFVLDHVGSSWWWLVVEPADSDDITALLDLDREVRQVYAEIEEEKHQATMAAIAEMVRKKPKPRP